MWANAQRDLSFLTSNMEWISLCLYGTDLFCITKMSHKPFKTQTNFKGMLF